MAERSKYTRKLEGKRVLVIGGTSGIGYAVCEASLEHGASVTISSSSPSKITATLEKLKTRYPSASSRVSGIPCNLSGPAMEDNIRALFVKTGTLDHVVFTAGDALVLNPIHEVTYGSIVAAGTVRFIAPLLVAKHAASHLSPGPFSSITFTGAGLADKSRPGWTVPTAYAAGMRGIVNGLAIDLKPVRVNAVEPFATETEEWSAKSEDEVKSLREIIAEETLTGRVGTAEDVAVC